jgi:hypothetical protein
MAGGNRNGRESDLRVELRLREGAGSRGERPWGVSTEMGRARSTKT